MSHKRQPESVDRREFLARSATATTALALAAGGTTLSLAAQATADPTLISFSATDSLVHDSTWQSLNPGYWKVENGALRRRLSNYGDRARKTGFPFHAVTHGFEYKTEYDPTQPPGVIYQQQWKLNGRYKIKATFTYRGDCPEPADGDDPSWKMFQPGTGLMGIAIGSPSVFQSHVQLKHANLIAWTDDQACRFVPSKANEKSIPTTVFGKHRPLQVGQRYTVEVDVNPIDAQQSNVKIALTAGDDKQPASFEATVPRNAVEGFAGIAAGGLIDFEVNQFSVEPFENKPRAIGFNDCFACYPLGDTLAQFDGDWKVRFVAMFASDGQLVELRIADSQSPAGGWDAVPIAGSAKVVNNQWRRNTSVIHATLPVNPAEKTLYYTIWKDGVNVTADARVGTDACGPGTGFVGDVPASGSYVGRLPQLVAPYKVCGLSCHAISGSFQRKTDTGWQFDRQKVTPEWTVRDQPSPESFKHLDDYNFQVMLWEDDVWYMELLLYPPSTDDAYKVVTQSICGPTSRWQMMRHWNVINPGDHDYGMDDYKGPEQFVLRNTEGLGQDRDYLRRNFQIVHHLTTGEEEVDPTINPKKWRAWKVPDRDFTLIVLDSRLWRSSQDVDIWDDAGWGAFKSLYDRTDPTRSLLGEEQFGWLQE